MVADEIGEKARVRAEVTSISGDGCENVVEAFVNRVAQRILCGQPLFLENGNDPALPLLRGFPLMGQRFLFATGKEKEALACRLRCFGAEQRLDQLPLDPTVQAVAVGRRRGC